VEWTRPGSDGRIVSPRDAAAARSGGDPPRTIRAEMHGLLGSGPTNSPVGTSTTGRDQHADARSNASGRPHERRPVIPIISRRTDPAAGPNTGVVTPPETMPPVLAAGNQQGLLS